jgi:hypothetical protein
MHTLAESFINAHPIEIQVIDERALFPQEGLIEDSIALVSADALGYERFDQIFTATYRLGNTQLVAYFSRRQSPGEAQELAAAYADFLTAFGGSAAESDPTIPAARMIYILDTYEIVFSHDHYLIGVREAPEKQPAQQLARRLLNGIQEATPESDARN